MTPRVAIPTVLAPSGVRSGQHAQVPGVVTAGADTSEGAWSELTHDTIQYVEVWRA